MISNRDLQFQVEDFVESLKNLQKFSSEEKDKLLLAEAEVTGKFIRADLGVFRNKDDHSVWALQKGADGKDYIIRTENFDTVKDSDWTASANRTEDNVTLAYKNYPIFRFAKDQFNYKDARDFAEFIVQKAVQGGRNFATKLAKALSFEERVALQKKYSIFREG